jgi:predicted RNA methylase
MTLLRDIASELVGMFLADARLTCAILILVALVAVLISGIGMDAGAGGAILTIGCLLILVEAAAREARKNKPE